MQFMKRVHTQYKVQAGSSVFDKWLDTFIEEKGIDLDGSFEVKSQQGTPNWMTYQNVIDAIKQTSDAEQRGIKTMLVKLDVSNADITKYLRHLAQAIALD